MHRFFIAAGVVLLTAGELAAQGRVADIPPHWTCARLRRLAVVGTTASSTFGQPDGPYAAARAVDGNRGTKWVASIAASESSPQSIVLELTGLQRLSAVALFGEAPGNDGVRDAQVQVATSPAADFSTVAAIKNAKSRAWLATFEPVKAAAVRLLITRSGGRSTHADVYEIELYGPPPAPAELEAYAAERLRGCIERTKAVDAAVGKLQYGANPLPAEVRRAVAALHAQVQQASLRLAGWKTLPPSDRQSLADTVERLEIKAQRLPGWLTAAARSGPHRAEQIESARETARKLGARDKAQVLRDGARVHLLNRQLLVTVDEAGDRWDATWLSGPVLKCVPLLGTSSAGAHEKTLLLRSSGTPSRAQVPAPAHLDRVEAAVREARFAADVDQRQLPLVACKTQVGSFRDKLGSGVEIRQCWGNAVKIERCLRVYDGKPHLTISGRITNATHHDVALGSVRMIDTGPGNRGGWHFGGLVQAPAAVGYPGMSPPCRPAADGGGPGDSAASYSSSGVLAFAAQEPTGGFVLGYLTAREGSPSVQAQFEPGQGGRSLSAALGLHGRLLAAGQSLALDTVWLSAEPDPFLALERYGDAIATLSSSPVRTGANALWCSWYPLRMGISEEVVLANAAVAAKHFKPLGFDLMQLDHGWQIGDICGDWEPNERFAHGLKWLSAQLASRYGMKLGLWIAPTVVSGSSQLFREHPDWMLKDPDAKPAATGRWFWKPNPECYVLDASHPEAAQWIEQTFARLTGQGASYYKIDFIAGSGGSYQQHDPRCTRGWGVLGRGMEAIRRGSGPDAWIRYCQTPPLLSAGLASSAYIGQDTGDAGIGSTMSLLRDNMQLLAASYWVNDRLYHREVCDMSVGMKAGVEEARLRLALMTLGGCSISFSDDLRLLLPPRIRMMQQCLPPGNPPARPLDLFQREIPSLWHLHCAKRGSEAWDVVGLFNFADQTEQRTVDLAALGLPAATRVGVVEFWEEKFLGTHQRQITLAVPPHTSRILVIRPLTGRPQLLATDMHLLGGYHEVVAVNWDDARATLAGEYRRAPGLSGKAYLYVPSGYRPLVDAPAHASGLVDLGNGLWAQPVTFTGPSVTWTIRFARP